QLRVDSYLVSRALDGTIYNGIHFQLSRNLWQRLLGIFVSHDGSTGNHTELANLRELRDQGVGHSVREIVFPRVAGNVRERQHRDGANLRRVRATDEPIAQTTDIQGHQHDGQSQ